MTWQDAVRQSEFEVAFRTGTRNQSYRLKDGTEFFHPINRPSALQARTARNSRKTEVTDWQPLTDGVIHAADLDKMIAATTMQDRLQSQMRKAAAAADELHEMMKATSRDGLQSQMRKAADLIGSLSKLAEQLFDSKIEDDTIGPILDDMIDQATELRNML